MAAPSPAAWMSLITRRGWRSPPRTPPVRPRISPPVTVMTPTENPIVEEDRDGQNPREHQRKNRTEEEGEGADEKSKETGATCDATKASPADSSANEGGARDERGERNTPGTVTSAPYGDRTSNPSTDGATESDPSQAEIRGKIRALFKKPSLTDPASRRFDVERLVYMLHKAEKNERDGWDADVSDKKKQKTLKKQVEPPERKELRKARSVNKATTQNQRPVVKDAPASKEAREEGLDATGPKGREISESESR